MEPGPLNITFGSDMPITLLHMILIKIKSICKFLYEKCDRHVRSECDVQMSRLIRICVYVHLVYILFRGNPYEDL